MIVEDVNKEEFARQRSIREKVTDDGGIRFHKDDARKRSTGAFFEKRILELGGLDGHQRGKSYQTGYAVYSPDGICPTILADGGGYGIMIVEEQKLGNLYGYTGGNFAGNVYSKDGLCPGLLTMQGGNKQPMIVENKDGEKDYICIAMRGRNPDDPSDRSKGCHCEQRLEPNSHGICNTLTTVQKDNLVLERPLKTVVPCRMVRTEEGKKLRKDYESKKIHHGFNEFRELEIKDEEVANTLTSVQKDNLVLEKDYLEIKQATKEGSIKVKVGGCYDASYPDSTSRRGRVINGGDVTPTITAQGGENINYVETVYRIRKLTPNECFRLMGYKDSDFDKASEVNSSTQLYKQAGNAIVKQVLMAVFLQLGIKGKKRWNEMTVGERQELVDSSLDFIE